MKNITVNESVTLHQHYRGYLQIAAIDLTRAPAPALWLLHWDPTQPVATRPLSLRKNGIWYTYGHDFTKNVTELYNADSTIATAYDYTPYGTVTATGLEQPIQWSSEYYDSELALVYYNYRHYNPMDGRWINRDPIMEQGGYNLYGFVGNSGYKFIDKLGLDGEQAQDSDEKLYDYIIFTMVSKENIRPRNPLKKKVLNKMAKDILSDLLYEAVSSLGRVVDSITTIADFFQGGMRYGNVYYAYKCCTPTAEWKIGAERIEGSGMGSSHDIYSIGMEKIMETDRDAIIDEMHEEAKEVCREMVNEYLSQE